MGGGGGGGEGRISSGMLIVLLRVIKSKIPVSLKVLMTKHHYFQLSEYL